MPTPSPKNSTKRSDHAQPAKPFGQGQGEIGRHDAFRQPIAQPEPTTSGTRIATGNPAGRRLRSKRRRPSRGPQAHLIIGVWLVHPDERVRDGEKGTVPALDADHPVDATPGFS